jgi:hypothetical protein
MHFMYLCIVLFILLSKEEEHHEKYHKVNKNIFQNYGNLDPTTD